MNQPKYSLPEIERRWLVHAWYLDELAGLPCRIIEDVYVDGSLLRLRSIRAPDGEVIYKLCKKYGRRGALSNPITNIYLSRDEYLALRVLPGSRVVKHRHTVAGGAVDLYPASPPLAIFEIDFDSEQAATGYLPPPFAGEEVTDNTAYSGAALAMRFALRAEEHPLDP